MPPSRGSISSNGDAKPTCPRRVPAEVGPWEIIRASSWAGKKEFFSAAVHGLPRQMRR
jgi:hypothetical protein